MKRRLPLILILAILAVLVIALFLPRPLLKPNSNYEVLIVRYNPTYDAQPTDIPTFDSDAIVACLRNYKAENAFTTTPLPPPTQTSCWRSPSAKKWTKGTIGKPSGWAKQITSTSESLCTASQTATPSRTNCFKS